MEDWGSPAWAEWIFEEKTRQKISWGKGNKFNAFEGIHRKNGCVALWWVSGYTKPYNPPAEESNRKKRNTRKNGRN